MGTKLHLRAGDFEFSFESDDPISVADAKEFITQVQGIASSVAKAPKPPSAEKHDQGNGAADTGGASGDVPNLHVNSVAERLGAKSGSEVAMAAAAHLQLIEGKATFSRKELLDRMKEATNYYTQTMRSNLSSIIKGLIGSKLNQLNNDHFAIKSGELSNLRAVITE